MVLAEITGVVKLLDAVNKAVPPLVAAYQSMASPVAGVAEMETVPVPQIAAAVPVGAAGAGRTVAVTAVRVADAQPESTDCT